MDHFQHSPAVGVHDKSFANAVLSLFFFCAFGDPGMMAISLWSRWCLRQAGCEKHLTTTPHHGSQLELSEMGRATLFPHIGDAVGPERIPQPCSSCGAPSMGSQASTFLEMFLQSCAQLQLSTSICVPNHRGHQGALDVPSLVINLRLRLHWRMGSSSSRSWV